MGLSPGGSLCDSHPASFHLIPPRSPSPISASLFTDFEPEFINLPGLSSILSCVIRRAAFQLPGVVILCASPRLTEFFENIVSFLPSNNQQTL